MRLKGKISGLRGLFPIWLAILILSYAIYPYVPQYADEAKLQRLRWKSGTIKIAVSNSFSKPSSNIKSDSDIQGAIERSLGHWEEAANIEFISSISEKQSVSPEGRAGDGISLITSAPTSENLLLFSDKRMEISALTRVFYNAKGFITEADIVLNPYLQFSSDGTFGTFDLESTLTHEIGHLLGLDHSPVMGSTMNARQPKNGTYEMENFISRSLAEDDISGVAGIYGSRDAEGCCGSINGKILNKGIYRIWLEDMESGRIISGAATREDGSFSLDGLRIGKYRLLAQDKKNKKSAASLGEISIEKGKALSFQKSLRQIPNSFDLTHLGFNSRLAATAIGLNSGKSYLLFLGGQGLNTDDFEVSFDSPYIKAFPASFFPLDFGSSISVFSFEIAIAKEAPLGEYVIKAKKSNGEVDYLLGGITIENFVNPHSHRNFQFD